MPWSRNQIRTIMPFFHESKKNLFKHIIIGPNVLHRIEYGGVYIRVSKDVVDHDDLLCIKNQFKTSQEDFKKPETNRNVLFLNRKLKIL